MFDPDVWLKDRAKVRCLARTRMAALKEAQDRLVTAARGTIAPDPSEGIPPTDNAEIERLLTDIDRAVAGLQQIEGELSQIETQTQEAHSAINAFKTKRWQRVELEQRLEELHAARLVLQKQARRRLFLLIVVGAALIVAAFVGSPAN